jgi:tRNA pseudouridine13 synthase
MKLKRIPEDFQVEELTDVVAQDTGKFTLYSLEKRSLGTLEAIAAIQQRWKIDRRRISWGGLKDKHAVTRQYFTIFGGPQRGMQQEKLTVECLGMIDHEFTAAHIAGNRFEVTLRNLTQTQVEDSRSRLASLEQTGVPNYFDDQRFGSISLDGQFIAQPWIAGDYERSIWLAFAEPNAFDSSSEKKEKAILRDCWGDWPKCKASLSRSHRRSVITFLADRPGDFKGAWSIVNKDLRSLYLAAFQSQLWNEILSRYIELTYSASHRIQQTMKSGTFWFPQLVSHDKPQLDSSVSSESEMAIEIPEGSLPTANNASGTAQAVRYESLEGSRPSATDASGTAQAVRYESPRTTTEVSIPLPSARIQLESIEDALIRRCAEDVLTVRGLELRQLRVKHPRDSFFSKGSRTAINRVTGLSISDGADELHSKRRYLRIAFTLTRGAYATMIVKYLKLPPEQ